MVRLNPGSLKGQLLVGATALALLTTACSGSSQSPSASASAATSSAPAATSSAPAASGSQAAAEIGAPEQDTVTVVVDRNAFSAEQTFLIAADKGWYKDEGLTVKVISSDDARAAVLGGSADIGVTDPSLVVEGINSGLDLEIIAGNKCRQQFTFAVAPGIKTVTDLNGKDVLLAGTQGDKEFNSRKQVLKDNGWDLDKATPNYVYVDGGSTVWAKLFTAGKLFLMPVFSSVRPAIEKYGGQIIVEKLVPQTNNVQFAKKSWYEANPNTAAHFFRATMKGEQFLLDMPKNKAEVIAIGEKNGFDLTREKANDARYAMSQESDCGNLYFSKEAWEKLVKFLGLDPTPFDKVADITQLLKAQQSLGLDNSPPAEIPFPG